MPSGNGWGVCVRDELGGWDWYIYTVDILCMKQATNESLLYNSVLCVTKVGRKYKKEGMYVCVRLIHFAIQQKLTAV